MSARNRRIGKIKAPGKCLLWERRAPSAADFGILSHAHCIQSQKNIYNPLEERKRLKKNKRVPIRSSNHNSLGTASTEGHYTMLLYWLGPSLCCSKLAAFLLHVVRLTPMTYRAAWVCVCVCWGGGGGGYHHSVLAHILLLSRALPAYSHSVSLPVTDANRPAD